MKLSVIIPSWKDPYLVKTINSLLENTGLGNSMEIIVVLDGYWPNFDLVIEPRVKYIHLGKNRGMRDAINTGIKLAQGEFIMRSDEHCLFAPEFDKTLVEACQPNWIMTGIRYFLDPEKWKVIDEIPPFIYEKLAIRDDDQNPGHPLKFEGQRWRSRDKARSSVLIDRTMAMQGSVWLMPKAWWESTIVALQTEGYGPLYQDSHEMVFKTWKAGGELMLHKGTWFAHKHYKFKRTHNYGRREAYPGWQYGLKVWKEFYETEVRPKWSAET